MAFDELSLFARLWEKRGLRLLLREGTVPLGESLLVWGMPYGAKGPPAQRLRSAAQAQVGMPPKAVPPRPSTPAREPAEVAKAPAAWARSPLPTPEHWPPEWQGLISQVRKGRVVWTYPQLGSDLLRRQSAGLDDRRRFLGRIMAEKPLYPAGTHTFWPYTLALGQEALQPELFWAGVRALGSRVVMVLGEEAGAVLLQHRVPYRQKRLHGVEAVLFQSLEQLMQSEELYDRMLEFMRAMLFREEIYPLRAAEA